MIRVDFLALPDGELTGFRVEGHSGYAEEGADIVCAAVSSAVYFTVNTITEVLLVPPLSLRAEEGELFFRVEEGDGPVCRPLFQGLKLHLVQLEEQYPGFLRVDELEL